jgi:hypothetical protein
MDGILRCSRYAFGPNRLHYCGPDQNPELRAYIESSAQDPGLEHLLGKFKAMYPYLRFIADENDIRNPFDARVVEAYWLGNELLERVEKKHLRRHLVESYGAKKKTSAKEFAQLEEKLGAGAVPHHSFHVLDVWRTTGRKEWDHTLPMLDECRVGWGRVVSADGPSLTVKTEPLVLENGKLALGAPVEKILARKLESEYDIEQVRPGEWVSIHWSVPCEVLTPQQVATLKRFTLRHIALANRTI